LLSKAVNPSKDETSSNYFFPARPQISNPSLFCILSFVVVLVVVFFLSLSFLKHIFDQYRLTLTKMNEEQPQLPIFFMSHYNNFLYLLVTFVTRSITYLWI